MTTIIKINPKLDLIFERTTQLSPTQIWKAWTDPKTLMLWFCPKPWKVTDCRVELYSGGEFYTLMQGPAGEILPNHGSFLEVVENKKLVWTNMMTASYKPVAVDTKMGFMFTVTLLLSSCPQGTLYKAIVSHADEEGRKKHEQMGFQEGWGIAFQQLEELLKS